MNTTTITQVQKSVTRDAFDMLKEFLKPIVKEVLFEVANTRVDKLDDSNVEECSKVLTTSEAAEIAQVTEGTIRKYCRNKMIKSVRVGRDYRITKESLNDFLGTKSKKV